MTTAAATRCFVAADFSQLETWLTAHFAHDTVMLGELEESLHGGPKIHARNAALIYGIAVEDAETTKVQLQGQEKSAYDGGKRFGHAFNYNMGAGHAAKTFWLPLAFTTEVISKLSAKYASTVEHRVELADQVFGVYRYRCARCGLVQVRDGGRCPRCSTARRPVMLQWDGVEREAEKVLYTPFGRRRIYLGRRSDGANAVASQEPQSSGASIWYRTLGRLNGYDFYDDSDARWPHPPGSAIWSPRLDVYSQLYAPFETFVATGTYDSFLLETTYGQAEETLEWLLWTMEQPWPELNGRRIPAEGSIGFNWGKHDAERNAAGLAKQPRPAFTARCPERFRNV